MPSQRRKALADTAWRIKEAVRHTLDELPAEKLEEVLDFVLLLKERATAKDRRSVQAQPPTALILHTLPASHLHSLTGLVAWSGDALADSERLYNGDVDTDRD
jgi:hypothetical protein